MKTEVSDVLLDGRTVTVTVRNGLIAGIAPSLRPARQVMMPLAVDPHVHLDKTFTAARCARGAHGLFGAIETMSKDTQNWTEADLRARMTRALEEAAEGGIVALRSHVDWTTPKPPLAWHVLADIAQEWKTSIHIQRASLSSLDLVGDAQVGDRIAARIAQDGAVLGCFVYRNKDLKSRLETVFALAGKYDLALDFHVDEGLEIEADAFDHIVALTQRHSMGGRVLCGHACSLSVREKSDVARVLNHAAEAGVALTVLPTTNQWLQDHQEGRAPRLRGLAPMHELRAAGVPVVLGADNVADPFYRYGVYDAVETLRTATLAAHLTPANWLDAITHTAARAISFDLARIEVGAAASFILIDGADLDEALRCPRARREVVRHGKSTYVEEQAA